MTADTNPTARRTYTARYAIIGALALILAVAQLNAAISTITPPAPHTMRYWQIVRFKFRAHSPVIDQDIDTAGYVVFAYDPLTQKPELISVEDAAAAVKAGKAKDEPSPSPSPSPMSVSP